MPLFPSQAIRHAMVLQVRALVGGTGDDSVERNRRDTGLFGPDSACWKVHGDFTAMMVGGVAALLMQMLHPGALAGVWDHSDFRRDMPGRLKRTARFIAGVTYGDRAEAEAFLARVRQVHAGVSGTLPDGAPYAADDPDLLRWVHVAEVTAFMGAYLRYADPGFPPPEQDRYYREVAEIARQLGAVDVPQNREEIGAYLDRTGASLRYDHRTREVAGVLLAQRPPSALAAPAMSAIFEAAKDLLPPWAAQMHGFRQSRVRRAAARGAVAGLARTMRWALVNSAEARARRRAEELASAPAGAKFQVGALEDALGGAQLRRAEPGPSGDRSRS